jgi:Zn-dependent protease with chaperone function
LFGHSTKAIDSLVSRVIPIDAMDEAELGQILAARYETSTNKQDPTYRYLNDLVRHQSPFLRKRFTYQVYVLEWQVPNATALPGGVILVTQGLLRVVTSEAELMSVLAHELGHVERGHCVDAVKFELFTRKIARISYGKIADIAVDLLVRHSFSKTLEDQADEYAFALLSESVYDPRGVGGAFEQLLNYESGGRHVQRNARADPLRDYFMSHPPLALRKEKFQQRAEAWWRAHPNERRFVGRNNLVQRRSFYSGYQNAEEWTAVMNGDGSSAT